MKKGFILFLMWSCILLGADYTSKLLGDTKGNLILKENIYEVHPFASLTKVMTTVITIEEIEKGKFSYDDLVTVPKETEKYKESTIDLRSGQKISVNDLLYATMVHSANDAAYTLAYYISGGNVDNFIDMMNKKAKEIGMLNTTYCTPNGLPSRITGKGMDRGTAFDMYKLSMYAIKKDKILEIAGTKSIAILNGKKTIQNRNKLLGKVPGVYGLKTGFHDDSMYNISIAFKKENEDYITILFGGKTALSRDNEMTRTITNFIPPVFKDTVTYIKEDINLYKNNNAVYLDDNTSVIHNIIKEGREINSNSFDKPLLLKGNE